MSWNAAKPADDGFIGVGPSEIRANWDALSTVVGATRLANGTAIVDPIPGGNTFKMWIYADTAPSGWTIDSTPSDELLAVKGGSTYTTGAATAGTWTQPDHTLTSDEIPAHTHTMAVYTDMGAAGSRRSATDGAGSQSTMVSGSTGGGSAHNHGTTYRPKARVGIIASAD